MSDQGGRPLAVVSGAASGIGKATALALAAKGDAVVGLDLAPCPAELREEAGVEWVQGDVSDPGAWEEIVGICEGIDPAGAGAFVACAADVSAQPFLATPVEEWRRLFENNVIGVVAGIKALLPAMLARRSGAMVVTCSVSSLFAEPDLSAYAASKSALLSLTRSVALEHAADGIRINAICPGSVDTPLLRKHLDSLENPAEALERMRQRIPTGELTRPDEVAALIGFLLDDAGSGLAGSAVVVDGGLTASYEFGAFSAA